MSVRLRNQTLESLPRSIRIPGYDRSAVRPGIVHFGVGGFHRSHQAVAVDDLLGQGETEWGICGVGLLPADAEMSRTMREQDNLYTVVSRAPDGSEDVRVIGSIVEYLYAPDDSRAVSRRLVDPTVAVVSLTITEGGYFIDHSTGAFDPDADAVRMDASSWSRPSTAFGFIVEALRQRRELGLPPFTVMSCDNIRLNGQAARAATVGMARLRSEDLARWIDENVGFPNSMVDRITPATTNADRQHLRHTYGIEDGWPVICEPFFQWALERDFSSRRPPYERAGVDVVEDVDPYELMKLRLLNGGHQVLAYLAAVVGYEYVHDVAGDALFAELLQRYWSAEAIPTLEPIPGVDYADYVSSLLHRFRNSYIRDTLERLGTDSSNRVPAFLLPVIADRLQRGLSLQASVLAIAGWARYAEGVDERDRMLPLHDIRADDLRRRALCWRSDPTAFVANREVFGELANEPQFVDAYGDAASSIHQLGVREAIATALMGRQS